METVTGERTIVSINIKLQFQEQTSNCQPVKSALLNKTSKLKVRKSLRYS